MENKPIGRDENGELIYNINRHESVLIYGTLLLGSALMIVLVRTLLWVLLIWK